MLSRKYRTAPRDSGICRCLQATHDGDCCLCLETVDDLRMVNDTKCHSLFQPVFVVLNRGVVMLEGKQMKGNATLAVLAKGLASTVDSLLSPSSTRSRRLS